MIITTIDNESIPRRVSAVIDWALRGNVALPDKVLNLPLADILPCTITVDSRVTDRSAPAVRLPAQTLLQAFGDAAAALGPYRGRSVRELWSRSSSWNSFADMYAETRKLFGNDVIPHYVTIDQHTQAPILISEEYDEHENFALHDVYAWLTIDNEHRGLITAQIMDPRGRVPTDLEFFDSADNDSQFLADAAVCLIDRHGGAHNVFATGAAFFVNTWIIDPTLRGHGHGIEFLEAVLMFTSRQVNKLHTVAVDVMPFDCPVYSRLSSYHPEVVEQFNQAYNRLLSYWTVCSPERVLDETSRAMHYCMAREGRSRNRADNYILESIARRHGSLPA